MGGAPVPIGPYDGLVRRSRMAVGIFFEFRIMKNKSTI